jgi:hypothetical protein
VSILSVAGIWVGSNILLFGWLVWQRVIAPPRCSLAQSVVVGAPLNQTSVVLLFAPLSLQPSSTNPRTLPRSTAINA